MTLTARILHQYFDQDDGSLPEVIVSFPSADAVATALRYLDTLGARNVTVGGGTWWSRTEQVDKPYSGIGDALRVLSGEADPLHFVLGGVYVAGCVLPDLGVFVDPDGLCLDYRMGDDWGEHEIAALLALLGNLEDAGGIVTVPCWGSEGEDAFLRAIHAQKVGGRA